MGFYERTDTMTIRQGKCVFHIHIIHNDSRMALEVKEHTHLRWQALEPTIRYARLLHQLRSTAEPTQRGIIAIAIVLEYI